MPGIFQFGLLVLFCRNLLNIVFIFSTQSQIRLLKLSLHQSIQIHFCFIVIETFSFQNHSRIRSLKQPALSNSDKVSCSRKQEMAFEGIQTHTSTSDLWNTSLMANYSATPPSVSQSLYGGSQTVLVSIVQFRCSSIVSVIVISLYFHSVYQLFLSFIIFMTIGILKIHLNVRERC